ncbi:SH3 domain-containing protein [Kitasatospora sp. NPDC048286]|uniref:SH3 domain-containing protein n=1 Tax=unclassified Kitasatospora TaxID=2633591 RepID=UPI0037240EB7
MRKSAALLAAALVAGTALGLAPTVATAGTPGEAGLLSCSHAWSNLDPDGSHPKTITRSSVNIRSGPHAAPGTTCGIVGVLNPGDQVFYHCYTTTQSEGTWTHLRKSGTSLEGWVKDTLLPDGGSVYEC